MRKVTVLLLSMMLIVGCGAEKSNLSQVGISMEDVPVESVSVKEVQSIEPVIIASAIPTPIPTPVPVSVTNEIVDKVFITPSPTSTPTPVPSPTSTPEPKVIVRNDIDVNIPITQNNNVLKENESSSSIPKVTSTPIPTPTVTFTPVPTPIPTATATLIPTAISTPDIPILEVTPTSTPKTIQNTILVPDQSKSSIVGVYFPEGNTTFPSNIRHIFKIKNGKSYHYTSVGSILADNFNENEIKNIDYSIFSSNFPLEGSINQPSISIQKEISNPAIYLVVEADPSGLWGKYKRTFVNVPTLQLYLNYFNIQKETVVPDGALSSIPLGKDIFAP
jgi:hypothetical protein